MANNGLAVIKHYLSQQEVRTRFNDILGKKSPQFMASVINAVAGNEKLKNCDQQSVLGAAFVAASLDLPIDTNLGRAYIIPYGGKAQFQVGYRGLVELAIRTGQYRDMNSVEVYEDEIKEYNPILGKLKFVDDFSKCTQRASGQEDKIVGYYAFYELLTGFSKGLYMTKEQVINHAQKYSQTYNFKGGVWQTHFNEMAKKTVLKRLLSKWATLSVEMQKAVIEDQKVYDSQGNGEYLDNMPPADPVDELASSVVDEFKPEPQKEDEKPQEKPQEKEPAPKKGKKEDEKPVANMENDFANFEAGFEQGLPFA